MKHGLKVFQDKISMKTFYLMRKKSKDEVKSEFILRSDDKKFMVIELKDQKTDLSINHKTEEKSSGLQKFSNNIKNIL